MPKGPKEWSPRARVRELEDLARKMVGDGKKPNLFFVSLDGNIILISRDFETAYGEWKKHATRRNAETALEDRLWGVIASVEPESDDPGSRFVLFDDSVYFLKSHPQE